MPVPVSLSDLVRSLVLQAGFDLAGFAAAIPLDEEMQAFGTWLEMGYHADMAYMERNADKRRDVRNILPGARSVISVGMNYFTPHQHDHNTDHGKISRYAWGDDYHDVLGARMDGVIAQLKEQFPDDAFVRYVDTGPVAEKAWAVRSGIGWQGKNSNILSRSIGSYFFIGVIITTLELESDALSADFCGTCTACIDACPTAAIISPAVVDARRCISYWTIETKGEGAMPDVIRDNLDGWIYGCDVCQEVCPWNRFSKPTTEASFEPRHAQVSLDLDEVDAMDTEMFASRFRKSSMKRTKLKGIQRNARELRSYYERVSSKNPSEYES